MSSEKSQKLAIEPGLFRIQCLANEKLPGFIQLLIDEREGGVVCAIERRAKKLLESYAERFNDGSHRKSVRRLCELCNISLDGFEPPPLRQGIYSAHSYRSQGDRCSGKLIFSKNSAIIRIPRAVERPRARIAVAHEIGHWLIRSEGNKIHSDVLKIPASQAEEVLAEYCARCILLPRSEFTIGQLNSNLATSAIVQARDCDVTLHASAARLGDPDSLDLRVRGAILWGLNKSVPPTKPLSRRLTPRWHLCSNAFIPVNKSRAREDSLTARMGGDLSKSISEGIEIESMDIGTLTGKFEVHSCAWGSVESGTRLVLSIILDI